MRQRLRASMLAAGLLSAAVGLSPAQAPRLTVADALERYARGEFDAAVTGLNTAGLKTGEFLRVLDAWIDASAADARARRRLVASAFALDANWTATQNIFNLGDANRDSWGHVTPHTPDQWRLDQLLSQQVIPVWVARQLPASGDVDALERWLWLATVGVAEDGHAWNRLEHEILPRVSRRLPNEPRVRLARVLASTNQQLGSLRTSFNGILRVERRAFSGIPESIRAFEPLRADAALAGEVELRIGYLELRRNRWQDALARFAAAKTTLTEPVLVAAADYFTGFVHEQLDQEDAAIAAYRRALASTPQMRNLATRLSALLYQRGERADSYAILDPALNARPAPLDLLVVVERADARFVPEWLAEIRRGLR